MYCITGREVTKIRWNHFWESVETAEVSSGEAGTSCRLSGTAAECGNYDTTICESGAASFTSVPSACSMCIGSTGG
jgi:hypothetical protein